MYQDIHLNDKTQWNGVQIDWMNSDYANMLAKLQDIQLAEKVINADMFGNICDAILALENQYFGDDDFKADRIQVSATPPTGLTVGKVYFKLN